MYINFNSIFVFKFENSSIFRITNNNLIEFNKIYYCRNTMFGERYRNIFKIKLREENFLEVRDSPYIKVKFDMFLRRKCTLYNMLLYFHFHKISFKVYFLQFLKILIRYLFLNWKISVFLESQIII